MGLPFSKMHGLGNDYVFIDAMTGATREASRDWPALARKVSPRHTGIGSDGLILLCPPTLPGAHFRMRIFNADGSEAQMCGNGVRCLVKFARERAGLSPEIARVEAGTSRRRVVEVTPTFDDRRVMNGATVDMGVVTVGAEAAGFDGSHALSAGGPTYAVMVGDRPVLFVPASVGNPHAVVVDQATLDHSRIGPAIEHHPAFPERTNVHFVRVKGTDAAHMVTWERGSGFTQACGSGACAVTAVTFALGLTGPRVRCSLPGGDLDIQIAPQGQALMTGPAEEAFVGEIFG